MAVYHVGCGEISGRIYAGTINKKGDKWVNKTDVTEEEKAAGIHFNKSGRKVDAKGRFVKLKN